MIGSRLGNYRITEKIDSGGMGEVFKGVDLMLEREVAIKMLRPELACQPQVVERFRQEAMTLARLNHPHIATLYSFLRDGDDYFMVMEYVAGLTVAEIIRRQGAMPLSAAILLILQALDGLGHAHSLGIIHRDIKTSNLMVSTAGALKLMDFGIARVLGSARLTREGRLIGTLEYMSPEQIRGQETDARSDLYSLGILLYEILSGRVPFQSGSDYELMRSQVEVAPPPPRQFAPHIPESVERIILRALAKEPEDRFQSAAEFREAILSCPEAEDLTSDATQWIRFDQTQAVNISNSDEAAKEAQQPSDLRKALDEAELKKEALGTMSSAPAVAPGSTVIAVARRASSLFTKLDWRYYVGAASAGMLIVGVILGAMGLRGSNGGSPTSRKESEIHAAIPAASVMPIEATLLPAQSAAASPSPPGQVTDWPAQSVADAWPGPPAQTGKTSRRTDGQKGNSLTPEEKERRRRALLRELEQKD